MTFVTSTAHQHSSSASGLRPDRIHRPRSPKPRGNEANRQNGQPLPQPAPINGAGVAAFLFGRFCLVLHRRELLADGLPVPIGNRALDVLIVLIEARGELVTKDELLSRVWPTTTVEENNLQFQISALRKALGRDRDLIKTVPGRGYRFIADITVGGLAPRVGEREVISDQGATTAIAQLHEPPSNLPAPTSDLVGREVELSDVAALVAANRLVTLVGAGGIGKMRLGIKLARRLLPNFADGAWVAELGPLSDPALVPRAIATALGLSDAGDSAERLATFDRMITSMIEEAEAINWYEQRISVEKDSQARAIMKNAQKEEFKHFGMDLEFLLRQMPAWRAELKEILFTKGDIVDRDEAAERKVD